MESIALNTKVQQGKHVILVNTLLNLDYLQKFIYYFYYCMEKCQYIELSIRYKIFFDIEEE